MSYYEFASDSGTGFGSLEAFHTDEHPITSTGERFDNYAETVQAGWYWWPCFPGCLPDGDATGPFQTEREAVEDAGGIWDDLSENNGAIL
jgi:hypothetical protein